MSSFSHITKDYVVRQNRARLDSLCQNVATLEGQLRNARDLLSAEVESQGLSTKGLFGSTFFIPRTTANSWLEDARHEFEKREVRNARELRATLKKLTTADGNNSTAVEKPTVTDEDVRRAERAHTAALIIRAGEERRRPIPASVVPPANTGDAYQDEVNATAAAIIAAGRRRRNEI